MFSNKEVKEKLNTLLELIGNHAVEGIMSIQYVQMELVEKEINDMINAIPDQEPGYAICYDEKRFRAEAKQLFNDIECLNSRPIITNIKTYENKCHDCKNSKVQWCAEPCVNCEGYSEYERKQ